MLKKSPYELGEDIESTLAEFLGNFALSSFAEYAKNPADADAQTKKQNAESLLQLAEKCIEKGGTYRLMKKIKI